ncbi:hypothetical protein AJ80_03516 [Polytolypa hystricis UAMH7299]|uniref:3-oxoacyl-[acyl-carrier-protein] reductase n=1 Tax=Polytolypa hystricis (strain UAMH7299) TaxID=1447883 RepID=A0A2B7YGU0_POLH7|nr:hypothetical protein AJ80_03516 [Polytolypa hystricis UAMH7299]
MAFNGKVIALTGAASGIGAATAKLLGSRGATLSLADVQEALLNKVAEEIRSESGVQVLTTVLDVRKTPEVDGWISETVKKFGKLDGAANLAGVVGKSIGLGGIADTDEDEWDFIIAVNLTGLMHCMRAQMKVIQDGGSIVNAASIAGLMGRAYNGPYAASKHGVIGLTKSAAKEIGARGVRVNCFAPGRIQTPMLAASGVTDSKAITAEADLVSLGRNGRPEEVATLIAFLLGEDSTYISGATYGVDGGWFC